MAESAVPILQVTNLHTHFTTKGGTVKAVDNVSFQLRPGETLGIVGESGSGKSITALSIMRLIPSAGKITDGSIQFKGEELLDKSEKEMRRIRGNAISMIFQDPMSSLNPVFTIGKQMVETIRVHERVTSAEAKLRAIELLNMVGIPDAAKRLKSYPHEFSGGMRQRVMIAMALACKPDVLIADEPTTALDVTIQAQILVLLKSLQEELGMAVIMITHDLGVVAEVCDRVMVMYAGKTVETTDMLGLFDRPKHPYTWGLLASIPRITAKKERLKAISGSPPDLRDLPAGCSFAPRCPRAMDRCHTFSPALLEDDPAHQVRCLLYDQKEGVPAP